MISTQRRGAQQLRLARFSSAAAQSPVLIHDAAARHRPRRSILRRVPLASVRSAFRPTGSPNVSTYNFDSNTAGLQLTLPAGNWTNSEQESTQPKENSETKRFDSRHRMESFAARAPEMVHSSKFFMRNSNNAHDPSPPGRRRFFFDSYNSAPRGVYQPVEEVISSVVNSPPWEEAFPSLIAAESGIPKNFLKEIFLHDYQYSSWHPPGLDISAAKRYIIRHENYQYRGRMLLQQALSDIFTKWFRYCFSAESRKELEYMLTEDATLLVVLALRAKIHTSLPVPDDVQMHKISRVLDATGTNPLAQPVVGLERFQNACTKRLDLTGFSRVGGYIHGLRKILAEIDKSEDTKNLETHLMGVFVSYLGARVAPNVDIIDPGMERAKIRSSSLWFEQLGLDYIFATVAQKVGSAKHMQELSTNTKDIRPFANNLEFEKWQKMAQEKYGHKYQEKGRDDIAEIRRELANLRGLVAMNISRTQLAPNTNKSQRTMKSLERLQVYLGEPRPQVSPHFVPKPIPESEPEREDPEREESLDDQIRSFFKKEKGYIPFPSLEDGASEDEKFDPSSNRKQNQANDVPKFFGAGGKGQKFGQKPPSAMKANGAATTETVSWESILLEDEGTFIVGKPSSKSQPTVAPPISLQSTKETTPPSSAISTREIEPEEHYSAPEATEIPKTLPVEPGEEQTGQQRQEPSNKDQDSKSEEREDKQVEEPDGPENEDTRSGEPKGQDEAQSASALSRIGGTFSRFFSR
ncbi:hypothetical protein ABW19_dt0206182 [Dactylella cylindrospora]|nr:hypothetical protein ABW19_dt0206182 [Dactylella cylindrospora]